LIYPYQRPAFERLCAIARAYVHTNFERLPIRPRGNVFIVGPSGTGKTHLAEQIATGAGMDLAYLPISVSEWIVMGSSQRGAPSTWRTIWKFLQDAAKREGCLIFLDELDKVGSLRNQGDWVRYQVTEAFSLLDRKIPRNMNDPDGDKLSEKQISEAENVLRNKTLILAGGAFQELWDASSPIGFGAVPGATIPKPDLKRLSEHIPPELSRRFGSQLITLPPLQETDYLDMLEQILPTLPDHWRSPYERMALTGIPEAVRLGQGPRYFEELLLEVVIQERLAVTSAFPPEKAAPAIEACPELIQSL
jgi:SpoVK/Ycf46/Vps4 family AAA+-type ATPase